MRGLDDMYVFKTVVDHGGLSAAGRHLHVPKSTLARRIVELEGRLRAPLFHRGARRFVLTTFGRECYEQCSKVVAEADKVFAMADRIRDVPAGSLHVICPPLLGEVLIEQLAAEFAIAAPEVRLHLEATTSVYDPRSVSADLVIYAAFEKLPDADVVARKIFTSEFALVAHPRALAGAPPIVTPEALKHFDCLGLGPKSSEWIWRLKHGRETRMVPFQPRFSTTQLSALRQAARQGLGIAALPLLLCAEDIEHGRLVRVLEGWEPPPVTIFAIYPSGRALTTAARRFLDLMIKRLPHISHRSQDRRQ
jgi:DNA-binding transcriptional LysR family regulator